ncbi:MAG: hypothetical protein HFE62_00170 [Firmicutes bacterium]|nr:hypothetical protein [Bacillota bacterium]
MRKILMFLAILSNILLSGCVAASYDVPDTVKIGSEIYKTGFYGDLWPDDISFTDEEYEIEKKTFKHLDNTTFDCVHAYIGPRANGVVYCIDSQWEEASEYYANDENFTYYCGLNVRYSTKDHEYNEIENIDLEKFEALTQFGKTHGYKPFDVVQNKVGELKETTIDLNQEEISTFFNFFKESNDGSFCSFKGDLFFVCDENMYLLRTRNMSENVINAVEVPKETAFYFIEIFEKFDDADS